MMDVEIFIGKAKLGLDQPAYIIAEAGVNHRCNLEWAKRMVEEAALAGADAIKFQSYKAATIAAKESPIYWNDKTIRTQLEAFQKSDCFGKIEFIELFEHCEKWGIEFLSTPFDRDAVHYLDQLGMRAFKISSSDLTNYVLLRQIAELGKPIFLSTGASDLDEIRSALTVLKPFDVDVVLLHCVLKYPTPDENANLLAIEGLADAFPGYLIGYSDHTLPGRDYLAPAVSVVLGAKVVEKHFSINLDFPGDDHYHSVDSSGLRQMVASIRRAEKLLGTPEVGYAEVEEQARLFARRSLVAKGSIPQGTQISADNLIPKRPGTGISPIHLDDVLGRKAKVDIDDDTILTWELLE
jgi:sialic acid synthase SpsE